MQESANRLEKLTLWLNDLFKDKPYELKPLFGDASFRRYLRLFVDDKQLMVMDAPPEKEKVKEFLEVADFLSLHDVRVPEIIAKDVDNGFIVLEDFGDELLSAQLNEESVNDFYQQAMKQIVHFFKIPEHKINLPKYDSDLLEKEMNLFTEWFLPYLEIEVTAEIEVLWQNTKQIVLKNISTQPQGFVHRDFHSRNLMILPDEPEFGVIDFQDAVVGAYSYDLISILRDVYVNWSYERVASWVAYYVDLLKGEKVVSDIELEKFQKDFDMMGVQRHLKILGIFIRLFQRDGKSGYLPNLPQTMHYLLDECAHLPELAEFNEWLSSVVLPVFIAKNTEQNGYLQSYVK